MVFHNIARHVGHWNRYIIIQTYYSKLSYYNNKADYFLYVIWRNCEEESDSTGRYCDFNDLDVIKNSTAAYTMYYVDQNGYIVHIIVI